jgi:hypothetical protein
VVVFLDRQFKGLSTKVSAGLDTTEEKKVNLLKNAAHYHRPHRHSIPEAKPNNGNKL